MCHLLFWPRSTSLPQAINVDWLSMKRDAPFCFTALENLEQPTDTRLNFTFIVFYSLDSLLN